MQIEKIIDTIVQWLKDYRITSKQNGFVVGVSGGIDSAVVSTLCAKTDAPVLLLDMPIHQKSNQLQRSSDHINWLTQSYPNVTGMQIDLTPVFDTFCQSIHADLAQPLTKLSLANARSRLRMTTLYYYAGLNQYLVTGTGNKVEDFGVGFFTKYGDGGVDISPIADLMKSEVFALAKKLNIIDSIQSAKPTDGLWEDDRSDEDQMGATYDELEWAMTVSNNESIDNLSARQKEVLAIYKRLNRASAHKMEPIPVCIIPDTLKS